MKFFAASVLLVMSLAVHAGTNSIVGAPNIIIKPYPLDTCVVDGMKLDGMGSPYVFIYHGQQVKLCCKDCEPIFLKKPDVYMKKIQAAESASKK